MNARKALLVAAAMSASPGAVGAETDSHVMILVAHGCPFHVPAGGTWVRQPTAMVRIGSYPTGSACDSMKGEVEAAIRDAFVAAERKDSDASAAGNVAYPGVYRAVCLPGGNRSGTGR